MNKHWVVHCGKQKTEGYMHLVWSSEAVLIFFMYFLEQGWDSSIYLQRFPLQSTEHLGNNSLGPPTSCCVKIPCLPSQSWRILWLSVGLPAYLLYHLLFSAWRRSGASLQPNAAGKEALACSELTHFSALSCLYSCPPASHCKGWYLSPFFLHTE